jgi:hypothetical protein
MASELLLSIGWTLILGIVWALFVFGTAIAWKCGELFMDFQMFRWISQQHISWDIENPNEAKKHERVFPKAPTRKR